MSGSVQIGIVGAGPMGAGIAHRLAAAGNSVRLYDHNAARSAVAAAGVAGFVESGPLELALRAEIVILAIRFPGTIEFARAHRGDLAGRIVIDICTPLDATYEHLALDSSTSGAEQLADVIPESRVVKAFNTNLAVTLPAAEIDGEGLDTFVASDDEVAKATVLAALAGGGLRGLDAGPLANSRVLEAMAALGIQLGDRYGLGQRFGFKYLPSGPLTRPSR